MSLSNPIFFNKQILGWMLAAAGSAVFAQAPAQPEPDNSRLDAELFYGLLVGEMSAQSGDNGAAYSLFLDSARKASSAQLYERAIQVALSARNGDAALQATQAWMRAFPGTVDANRYLVQILVNMNRLPELVAPLKRDLGLMAAADKLATIEMLQRYFARVADRKQATQTLEQILLGQTQDPATGPLAWAVIGQSRMQSGDVAGAVAAARRGAALNPLSGAPATLALALLQSSSEDVEPIIDSYLLGKPMPEYRMAYVRYLVGAQRLPAAYAQTVLLNSQSPLFADGWLLRGSLEAQNKQNAAAESALTTYVNLRAPTSGNIDSAEMDRPLVTAHVLLSQLAEQAGRYDDALNYLKRIESPQDALRVGVRQASVLARQGKLDQARTLIRGLPENLPDAGRAKINAEVQLLRDNKKPADAFRLMESAVQQFPEDFDLKYDLAMMAEKAGKLELMEQLMRQVIAAKPDYHAAYNALGYSLADRNVRLPEARLLVSKALEFAPKDPFIVDSMAWVEFRSGNTAEAARLLQGAFKERPDAEIAAHLGEVLWTLGQRDEAKAIWSEGMRLNPDNETLLETTRRLRDTP